MKRKPKYLKPTEPRKLPYVILCIVALLLGIITIVVILVDSREIPPETIPTDEPVITTETQLPETTEPSESVETEPVMLPKMAELYEKNKDVVGWIRIDDTKLDYPVMFTPDDEERYIRANFEGNFDLSGLPFVDKDCSVEPESDNLIIYGHNMKNGTGFKTLHSYVDKSYWEEHPNIYFSTLYEERNYEIIAAFYDRVYYKHEDVFKFYQFIDAEDEAHFNEAMSYYKKKALYDTGVTAEYGDHLITLVTCSYHVDDGRFVVVAREVTDETD